MFAKSYLYWVLFIFPIYELAIPTVTSPGHHCIFNGPLHAPHRSLCKASLQPLFPGQIDLSRPNLKIPLKSYNGFTRIYTRQGGL